MTTTKTTIDVVLNFEAETKKLRPDWPSSYIGDLVASIAAEQHLVVGESEAEELEGALDAYLSDLESYLSEKEDFVGDYPTLEFLVDDLEVSFGDDPRMPEAMEWELEPKNVGSLADKIRDLTNAAWDLKEKLRHLCTGPAARTESEIKEIILELIR